MRDFVSLKPVELDRFLARWKASAALYPESDMTLHLEAVLERARQLVPAEAGAILLDDPTDKGPTRGRNRLYFVSAFGPVASALVGRAISATDGVAGEVYRTARPHLSVRGSEASVFAPLITEMTGYPTASIIAVPIELGRTTCGVVQLINRSDGEPFTARDLTLLEVFAGYTASVLENALDARHAQELARKDDLTGLYNDRWLHYRMLEALEDAEATGAGCALLFVDLDHFKPINDTYGHLVGSQVLREVGYLLRRATSAWDAIVARYGGDEFAIVLPGQTLKDAVALAEQIRRTVETNVFLEREHAPDLPALSLSGILTASIGATVYRPGFSAIPIETRKAELLRVADQAMYAAKQAGKNRVKTAEWRPQRQAAAV